MIYYIFGDENPTFVSSYKKALYDTDDIRRALDRFNAINQNHKYRNTYLVCDFEIQNTKLFKYARIRDGEESIPFLVLAEFHEGEDTPLETVRADTIIVESGGFKHEFTNNVKAMIQFETNLINHKDTSIYINYKYINAEGLDCVNRANICSSDQILDNIDSNKKIKKFFLEPIYNWENNSIKVPFEMVKL